jgi:hypothetical protein
MASPVYSQTGRCCQAHTNRNKDTKHCRDASVFEEEVILAIDMKSSGHLGCAYYTASANCLSIFEDVATADTKLMESLLIHTQPSTVVAHSRASETLLEYLNIHSKATYTGNIAPSSCRDTE